MSVNRAKELRLPLMNLVRLKGTPILEQLHLEERLLRTSSANWCIVNDGTNVPTIVMGMSGKPSHLLEVEHVIKDRIPVIKRFTGGGTVVVDKSTLFVSLICNKDDVPNVQPYPRSVMAWSGSLYGEVFKGVNGFQLRENDYVFGDRKFGGNAQSITRNRWIHHTSFLWDYNVRNMAYLKLPSRVPQYRLERDHTDFVCRMKDYIGGSEFFEKTIKAVENQFTLRQVNLDDIDSYAKGVHFKTTKVLTLEELEEAMAGVINFLISSHSTSWSFSGLLLKNLLMLEVYWSQSIWSPLYVLQLMMTAVIMTKLMMMVPGLRHVVSVPRNLQGRLSSDDVDPASVCAMNNILLGHIELSG